MQNGNKCFGPQLTNRIIALLAKGPSNDLAHAYACALSEYNLAVNCSGQTLAPTQGITNINHATTIPDINCLSFQHFPFDLRDETQFEPIIQHHYFCIILPAININQRSASRKKTSIHKRKFKPLHGFKAKKKSL